MRASAIRAVSDDYALGWNLRMWQKFVARLRYKPGSTIEVREHSAYTMLLVVTQTLPDAEGVSKEPIMVRLSEAIPPMIEEPEHALDFVREVIRKAEMHEIDEWLRFDGKRPHEPHGR